MDGRHPVHLTHLVMGLTFLGVAICWLLAEADVLSGRELGLLAPAPFLLAGLLGLVALAVNRRRRSRAHTTGRQGPAA